MACRPRETCSVGRRPAKRSEWCLFRLSFSKLLSPLYVDQWTRTGNRRLPPLVSAAAAAAVVIVVPFIRLCANFSHTTATANARGWRSLYPREIKRVASSFLCFPTCFDLLSSLILLSNNLKIQSKPDIKSPLMKLICLQSSHFVALINLFG